MLTSAVLSRIKEIQAAFSVFSLLEFGSQFSPPNTNVSDGSCFDFIVVGGGTSGCVVSARLVEAGFSVLVIEAGGFSNVESFYPGVVTYIKNTRVDWNYTAEPDGYTGKCHNSSAMLLPKVLGGAVETGYLSYSRGNPSDYEKWSKTVKDESFEWENMLKYFIKTENMRDPDILNSPYGKYHGTNGTLEISRDPSDVCDEYIRGFREAGQPVPIDNIGNASLGFARAQYHIFDGIRRGVAYEYIRPIKDDPKLIVTMYSLATKIIFDENNNARGVEFIKDGKKITVKAKCEVIISAGPIKSSQLLMLSGIGPDKELNKFGVKCISALPVGKNLQNIVGSVLVFKTNKTADPEPFNAHKTATPLVTGYSTINNSSIYPDYETLNFIIDDYYYFLSFCGFTLAFNSEICDRLNDMANGTQLLAVVLSNLKPKSRGEILLRSTNPEDSPKIITGYYSNDQDLDAVVNGIQHYMEIVSTPYFQKMGLEFIDPTFKCNHLKKKSKEYCRCYILCMMAATGRYVGTNAMGSVVDNEFYVYGVNKLRVVDASIIPNAIGGSTVPATVVLAERAAEMIIPVAKCE